MTSRVTKFGLTLTVSSFLAGLAYADDGPIRLTQDDLARSMHPSLSLAGIPIFPADDDLFHIYEDVCYLTGTDCVQRFVLPMVGRVKNGLAFLNVYGDEIILLDPRFLSAIDVEPELSIGLIGTYAVFAHELGHHVAGHLKDRNDIPSWQAELEADAFMGFAAKEYGARMSQVVSAFEELGIDEGSMTHPPLTKRVRAISIGFESATAQESIREASQ